MSGAFESNRENSIKLPHQVFEDIRSVQPDRIIRGVPIAPIVPNPLTELSIDRLDVADWSLHRDTDPFTRVMMDYYVLSD